jgi:hypothetical protein
MLLGDRDYGRDVCERAKGVGSVFEHAGGRVVEPRGEHRPRYAMPPAALCCAVHHHRPLLSLRAAAVSQHLLTL